MLTVKTLWMPAVTVHRCDTANATHYVVCSCHVLMCGVEVLMGKPGWQLPCSITASSQQPNKKQVNMHHLQSHHQSILIVQALLFERLIKLPALIKQICTDNRLNAALDRPYNCRHNSALNNSWEQKNPNTWFVCVIIFFFCTYKLTEQLTVRNGSLLEERKQRLES